MYVDDAADAALMVLEEYTGNDVLNIGTGEDHTIRELAHLAQRAVGFTGTIEFDTTKPDGVPRKALDSRRILGLGWTPQVGLEQGIALAYDWYLRSAARGD